MITVKHSGHIGDVIFSLAAVKAIAENQRDKIRYYLCEGVRIATDYDNGSPKPALTKGLCEFIKPLIDAQPYIEKCLTEFAVVSLDRPLNYDLDLFRRLPVNFYLGHLPLHYMHLTGHFSDYAVPWLTVKELDKDTDYSDKIIMGRSPRNINSNIDYSVLNKIRSEIVFFGTDDEYFDMKKIVRSIAHIKSSDAYHAARLIASCKLFIGNSSFHFAVAEGLKKSRLFEMNLKVQSLMPCGDVKYFTSTEQLVAGLQSAGFI